MKPKEKSEEMKAVVSQTGVPQLTAHLKLVPVLFPIMLRPEGERLEENLAATMSDDEGAQLHPTPRQPEPKKRERNVPLRFHQSPTCCEYHKLPRST